MPSCALSNVLDMKDDYALSMIMAQYIMFTLPSQFFVLSLNNTSITIYHAFLRFPNHTA